MRSTLTTVLPAMLLVLLALSPACASHQPPASPVAVGASDSQGDAVKVTEEDVPAGDEKSAEPRTEEETATASLPPDKAREAEAAEKPAAPKISLDQLVERLKQTDAIGFLTKLTIRSDVLEFKETVDGYKRNGGLAGRLKSLRGRFDGLLLKIVSLLDRDPALSKDIYRARESIWRSFLEEQL